MVSFITANEVPRSLRVWFVVHFIVDIIAAIPLILAPGKFGGLLGLPSIDPLTGRLVGAALIAIGTESWLSRNATRESFHALLRLKMLWSGAAVVGTALTISRGAPVAAWAVLAIFAGFHAIWLRYFLILRRAATNDVASLPD